MQKKPLPDSVVRRAAAISADAIICVDHRRLVTFFNHGAEAIFGWTEAEVIGQPLDMLIPSQFHAAHDKHMVAFAKAKETARLMGQRREVFGVRKDGTQFPAEAAIARVELGGNNAFSVVLRDVTERLRFIQENAELVDDLRAAVAARDDMLSIVSHDLRNPVNAVKMLASAILRTGEAEALPADVGDHAAVMLQAARQMDALIQDLLDVSKLESGRMAVDPQPVQIGELIDAASRILEPMADAMDVALSVSIPASVPLVDVDADRIVQVLSNLISNGIKYSAEGGKVHISAASDEDVVRISVEDAGVGIPESELPRVFDRFWQSKRTNRSGAGLGLTIARGLVRAHGGRMWIESAVGTGTSVHFTVPRAAPTRRR